MVMEINVRENRKEQSHKWNKHRNWHHKRQRKSKGATKNGTNTDTGNIDHTKTPDEDGERERERESTTKKTKIDEQHISHKKTWVNPGVHEWQVPVSNKTPTVLLIESSPI